jgi:predicted nucleotidyltransferase
MESLRSSDDFRDLLSLFNEEGVRYLIVGGFALAHYGRPRYTKDLDLWIDARDDNPARALRALSRFGAPLEHITVDDLTDPECIFQVGVEPIRVDILSAISGVQFGDAWARREQSSYGTVPVFVIAREDYIANKRAAGRARDLRDVEALLDDERA